MKIIQWNPELQRSIWENITPTKLIILPVIFGLLFMVVESTYNVVIMSLVLFYINTVMIGAYTAGEEIPNEVQDKTWDWQRMSAMTPLQMTIGKLFGSTIYQWYGGIITILVFIFSALSYNFNFLTVLQLVLCMIFTATFFQTFAMLLGISAREMPLRWRRLITIGILLSLAITLVSFFFFYLIIDFSKSIDKEFVSKNFHWFFISIPPLTHLLLLLIFMNIWSFIGLYRSFRTEMYYFNGPEFFMIFLIAVPIYFSGFLFNLSNDIIGFKFYFTVLFSTIAMLAYSSTFLTALIDKMEIITFRRLFFHLKLEDYKKVGYDIPLWAISFLTQIIFSLLALLLFTISMEEIGKIEENLPQKLLFFLITINLFCIRDLGIIMINNFTQGKNAIGTTIGYFFILYYLIPSLLAISGNEHLLPSFYPIPFDKHFEFSIVNIVIPMFQALIVILVVRKIWVTKNIKVQESINR